MHRNFSDWYRTISIDPRPETLESRWAAIESAPTPRVPELLDITRLMFNKIPQASKNLENFRLTFQKHDSTFPMRGNDAELGILAGSTIANILSDEPSYLSDVAALSVICMSFRGHRPLNSIQAEFTQLAQKYLDDEAIRVREASSTPNQIDATKIVTQFQSALAADPATNPFEKPLSAALKTALTPLIASINKTAADTETLTKNHKALAEEANIFWWLYSEHSRDIKVPISELEPACAGIIVAKELADLTTIIPPPIAATTFLHKMLQGIPAKKQKQIDVSSAINSLPSDWRISWRETLSNFSAIGDICPILYGVSRSLDSTRPEDWLGAFTQQTGINHGTKLPVSDLSMQSYLEICLQKAIAICDT